MSSDRCDWVQVVEPKSKEYIYVNLGTGECLWEAPSAVNVKKSDNNEWWELFDKKTERFYYYSTHLQTTVWHRPANCDIIPLAKLQMVKCPSVTSNNEQEAGKEELLVIKKEISTQTSAAAQVNTTNKKPEVGADGTADEDAEILALLEKSGDGLDDSGSHPKPLKKNQNASEESSEKETPSLETDLQVPVLPPRSPQIRANQIFEQDSHGNVGFRHYHPCPRERHSHPEATRHLASTLQRDITFPTVPQRSLEYPASSEIHDSFLDLPRSYVFQRTPESQMLANEFSSSLAHLPMDGSRPPCFLRQESCPSAVHDGSLGCAPGTGFTFRDGAGYAAFKAKTTSKPRAFPRTNPSYVGTYRRERQGPSYVKSPYGLLNVPAAAVGDDSSQQTMMSLNSRLSAVNGQLGYANFTEGVIEKRSAALGHDNPDARQLNTTFGTISKKQLSLWLGREDAAGLPFTNPCTGTGFHADEDENLAHSNRIVIANRYSDHGLLVDPRQLGVNKSLRPHNGIAHSDRFCDDPLMVQLRRRSEPEYVNVPTGHIRTKLGSNNIKPYFGGHLETQVGSLPDGYLEQGRDSRCSDPSSVDHISLDEYRNDYLDDPCLHSGRGLSPRNSDGLPDINCEDSDRASAQSTPSPQTRQFQMAVPTKLQQAVSVASTYHPSLRKKKWLDRSVAQPLARQSTLEKDWLMQTTDVNQHRPISMLTVSPSESNVIANKVAGTLLQQMHIEQFVLENLNEHRKGILGKTVSIGHMLSWTKDVIQKPMIRTTNKTVKKEAPEIFKLILMYMGDRKTKDPLSQIALDIIVRGWTVVELRDEIFIQLCRQTSKNPRGESAVQGWELLGICLAFFPPSSRFHSFLDDHIRKSIETHGIAEKSLTYLYMVSCERRLQWIVQVGAKKGLRKPAIEDVEHAKKSLLEPSMFGSTLDEIMNLQKDQFPDRLLPWIQTTLSELVLKLNGTQTEGIFRVPGDIDEVNALKVQCDKWNLPPNLTDPNLPASLLKLWYRELYEPLIPYAYHSQCLKNFDNPEGATAIIATLPEINRLVLTYLIRFLQEFAKPEIACVTKMDVNNLAMVMAPNCLRCLSNDPKIIFENTRREMGFIRTLIVNLDTSCVADLV